MDTEALIHLVRESDTAPSLPLLEGHGGTQMMSVAVHAISSKKDLQIIYTVLLY
jgi:hypothetical protein